MSDTIKDDTLLLVIIAIGWVILIIGFIPAHTKMLQALGSAFIIAGGVKSIHDVNHQRGSKKTASEIQWAKWNSQQDDWILKWDSNISESKPHRDDRCAQETRRQAVNIQRIFLLSHIHPNPLSL